MLVLLACAACAVLVGLLAAFVVAAQPVLDPGSPQATGRLVRRGLRARGWLHSVASARPQAASATSVALVASAVALVAGATTIGVLLWMVRARWGVADIDESAARWASEHATSRSTDVLRLVTDLGATTTVVVLALVVALVELRRARPGGVVAFLVLALAGQGVITNVVKHAVDRARPDIDPLGSYGGPSFPSGHSAAAAAAFAAFALVLGRRRGQRMRAWLFAAAGAAAGAVAATRVLLGVHWVTDVIAGVVLGWTWFACCAIAFGGRWLRYGAPVELAERTRAYGDP